MGNLLKASNLQNRGKYIIGKGILETPTFGFANGGTTGTVWHDMGTKCFREGILINRKCRLIIIDIKSFGHPSFMSNLRHHHNVISRINWICSSIASQTNWSLVKNQKKNVRYQAIYWKQRKKRIKLGSRTILHKRTSRFSQQSSKI